MLLNIYAVGVIRTYFVQRENMQHHERDQHDGQRHNVDWVAIDTAQASRRAEAFAPDRRRQLQLQLQLRDLQLQGYSPVANADGVVVLRRS